MDELPMGPTTKRKGRDKKEYKLQLAASSSFLRTEGSQEISYQTTGHYVNELELQQVSSLSEKKNYF